ncbi:MAG: alpha-ketoglutarate-dependent taurine dioxygenase, partial [Alteromonadaceae bacterium]
HGAILFRDFGLKDSADFERFAQAICPDLYGDYGDLPKEAGGEKIYHSTPYPQDKPILYHNESSHMNQWPTRQFFFCVTPSPIGGATPIVDCREVYQQLDPQVREQFEQKHLCYVRNFSRNIDVSWQNFFKTQDKKVVEQKCQKAGIELQWLADDGLRTREIRRAIVTHPDNGMKTFFNQIQLHHGAFLPTEVRQSLLELMGKEGLPRHVYFADGSEISDELALYTYEIYEKLSVRFEWQKGDLILLDNMAVAHARDPFEGERRINVAMAQMMNEAQIQEQEQKTIHHRPGQDARGIDLCRSNHPGTEVTEEKKGHRVGQLRGNS